MALVTRVARLFRADLNAVLDRIEEPDVLLKQALREMEEQISNDEQNVKALIKGLERDGAREEEFSQSLQRIEEEMDMCFAAGKHDLAKGLVRRKLEIERSRRDLERKRIHARDVLAELESQLQSDRDRLRDLRQQTDVVTTRGALWDSENPYDVTMEVIRDEDVEVAFLREQQKRGES